MDWGNTVNPFLSESNLYRLMLDGSRDPIFSFDRDYRYLYANQAFADGIGRNLDDVLGHTLWEVFSEDVAAKRFKLVKWVFDHKEPKTFEFWLSRHGVDHCYLTTLVPIFDHQGAVTAVAASSKDLTERKLAESRLLAAMAEAELANNAKSRFLAAASHDLRQPMAALTLYVDVLKARATKQNHDLVAKIEACCASMSELLNDLLDVSKLDAGVVAVKVSDFAIDEVLRALVNVHSAEASVKGLHLRLRPSRGAVVRTDPVLLTRVVGNLLSNAIRFTHKGGILVACRPRAGSLSLEVLDTGIGIAPEHTQTVFQEFTKLDETAGGAGSGMGLAIVSKIAALLGLPIRVQSKVGRGSVFAIELPTAGAARLSAPTAPAPATRLLRIGLVEDNAQVLGAMVLALEGAGHQVIAALTGQDLLTRLGQQAPDIIISDYRLTAGETGFDVVKAARAAFGNTLPALITTGDTDPALMRSMAKHGIEILYKPLHMDTLQRVIHDVAQGRSP